jgi:pyruvate dehydrogenase E1 component alpha subunit
LNLQVLYERMMLIRLLEDRLQRYCDEGIAGDLHFNRGQEAIAVGVCSVLRSTDKIVTHHRTIAHQIAKGAPLRPLVAELLGKRTGVNGGRAGEMHISDREIGHDFSFQLVGTCIPVGAGLAWAIKNHHKSDAVVAIFFGDAAASNGQFHEGLNLIAIHRLPVLLVCENNGRAGNITPEHYAPRDATGIIPPWVRAKGYGIGAGIVDGNDVGAVASAAAEMVDVIRRSGRPHFLECETERLCVKGNSMIIGVNKSIASVSAGELVLGRNGFTKITETFKRRYSGPMVSVTARGLLPFEVTPEHPVLVRRSITSRRKGTNHKIVGFAPFEWKAPVDLVPKRQQRDGDYLVMPRLRGTDVTKTIDVSRYYIERGLKAVRSKGYKTSFKLTSQLAWFIGLYVAEGSSAGKAGFVISLGSHEDELIVRTIGVARDILGRSTTVVVSESNHCTQIRINSSGISRALTDWCGRGAENKRVPSFILNHKDPKIFRSWLDGYAVGDGHWTKNGYVEITSVSRVLIMQVQLLLARLGYIGHVYSFSPTGVIMGRTVKAKVAYRIRWRMKPSRSPRQANQNVFAKYVLVPVTELRKARYEGDVYNLETKDHTYAVSNAVVHNCWHKQGQRDVRSKEELAKAAEGDPLFHVPPGISIDVVAIDKMLDEIFDSVRGDSSPSY